MDYNELGRIIRNRRNFLDLKQADVASGANVTNTFLSNIENGKANVIDIGKLYAICVYLDLDFSIFVRQISQNKQDRIVGEL
ncbi:MAG: helix-turn-helix transcriptional regulator [Erysipelotrichaceae bacterium]|nr:helix-turn-helix transcriptional regulator [Erysipelotrichaceae bacterium]MDD3809996.1 helix-turn-helix transcriptional regulator [Erysipelotrichaceae bacterium]